MAQRHPRPDVEDDLAQCHRLNQSTAARCVTGRSHCYLAATATAVKMSCQTVMDENKRKQEKTTPDYQTGTAPQECKWLLDGGHGAPEILAGISREKVGFRCPEKPESWF